jgi:hypothetical protein
MPTTRTQISIEIEEALRMGFTPVETAYLFDVDVSKVYSVRQNFIKPHRGRRKKKAKKKVVPLWKRPKRALGKKSKRQEPELHYDVYLRQKLLAEKIIRASKHRMVPYKDRQGRTRYRGLNCRSGHSTKHPGRLYRQEPESSIVPSPAILLDPEFDWLDTRYVGNLSWENLSWFERRRAKETRQRMFEVARRPSSKGRRKTNAEVEEEKTLFKKGYTRTSWGWQAPEEEEEEPAQDGHGDPLARDDRPDRA